VVIREHEEDIWPLGLGREQHGSEKEEGGKNLAHEKFQVMD
jgi:hypothetical protein